MIEVFKTNVVSDQQVADFIHLLEEHIPGAEVNFDLSDCDNILRIKSSRLDLATIRRIAEANNIFIEALD